MLQDNKSHKLFQSITFTDISGSLKQCAQAERTLQTKLLEINP